MTTRAKRLGARSIPTIFVALCSTAAVAAPAPRTEPKPARVDAPSDDIERRLVVFTDGASPRLASSGPSDVHGPLELEIRFRNANPLCYEYRTNVAASRAAATDQPLPDRVPGLGAFGAESSTNFAALEEAVTAVNNSETELDDVLNAARIQISLDDVWASCDGGGDFVAERARVETAARVAAQRLGVSGAWREVLENAEAVALGAKRLARELETGEHDASLDVDARKATLTDAEHKEADARDLASRAGHTKKTQADVDDASRDLASAQRKLREGELNLGRHHRGAALGHAAEHLGDRVKSAVATLAGDVAELGRARSLLAKSPTAIRRRFSAGETVRVTIERGRLDRGERRASNEPQVFEIPPFVTLRPVILDIGVGPSIAFGRNDAKYETVWSPKSAQDPIAAWRVERTQQGLPLDVVASLSAYLWEPRYFDDVSFDPRQLIPRPMIGVSLTHPTRQFYAGLEIDPVRFLDISAGVRFANEPKLIGPQLGDRALVDPSGAPQEPFTRDEVRPSGFVALTVSTNLLYRSIREGF